MIQPCLSLLQDEKRSRAIVTFCEGLDTALGGGIQTGRLTEISGVPGIGKTQLCLQLACDVQIPWELGGLGGEAVYVDMAGGPMLQRLTDLALATVAHCQQLAATIYTGSVESPKQLANFTDSRILDGIKCYSCHDYQQLLAVVQLLPELLTGHKKVKLIVLDNIAAHFRHDFDDFLLRTRLLTSLAQTLIRIARKHDVAIVVTNQMTTRIHKGDSSSQLVPALGESWGHACTNRLILQWQGDTRLMWLYKSPAMPQALVPYLITMDGVRDVAGPVASHTVDRSMGATTASGHHKTNSRVNDNTASGNCGNTKFVHGQSTDNVSGDRPMKRQRIS